VEFFFLLQTENFITIIVLLVGLILLGFGEVHKLKTLNYQGVGVVEV